MSEMTRNLFDPLLQVQKDAYRCGKCMLCKWVDHSLMSNSDFPEICPSGSRFRFESYFASGRQEIARGLLEGTLDYSDRLLHILFTCTECGGCQAICSNVCDRNPLKTIVALREKAFRDGVAPIPEHEALFSSMRNYGNPWQQPSYRKSRWAKGLGLLDATREEVDLLYFTGCTTALDPALREVAKATVDILCLAGVKVGTLGEKEPCCGSTLLRIGDYGSFERLALENLGILNRVSAEKIITSCAGCNSTLREDYPELGEMTLGVFHYVEVIADLIRSNKIPALKSSKTGKKKVVTYHDPCHLGRYCGIIDAPREIIESIGGLELVEMPRNRENSFCCGAGAGVKTAYPDYAMWVARRRVEEALSTGAELLITACPFCKQNLSQAAQGRIGVVDLIVLARDAILFS